MPDGRATIERCRAGMQHKKSLPECCVRAKAVLASLRPEDCFEKTLRRQRTNCSFGREAVKDAAVCFYVDSSRTMMPGDARYSVW